MKVPASSVVDSVRGRLAGSRFWSLVLAGYVAALGFLSLNPWVRPKASDEIFSPDKLEHALAYGGLTIIIYLSLCRSREVCGRCRQRGWAVAVIVAMLIGILIEVGQSMLTANRSGSVEDALANAIGALLGCGLFLAAEHLLSRRGAA